MGSGPRFQISRINGLGLGGLGIYVSRFPHSVSISISIIVINIYIGFGKGYDE
jgi:hypothetical protein